MLSRVDVAFELVQKQRALVETTEVGSPAHRQASDVLALIEESHFLLSELERTALPSPPVSTASLTSCEPRQPQPSRPARRFQLQLALAFAAALVAAAAFLEMADPAPMDIQASELTLAQP